ncbi:MAG: TRAP transporter substrate-binding protein DctP [Thermoleophilia bacterium]|nr:TRAP transporter substrate-binding protein DctP [Thermoleophilia bacterium]
MLLSVLVLVVALSGILVVSCGEDESSGEPVVLKMASAATGNYIDVEQAFVDAFNERCGPDYTIAFYPAEQMLSFPEMLDGIRTGAAEMGVVTPNFYSFDEPKLGAVELPFLLNNLDAHIAAMPELKPLYGEILEEQFNQKLLCLHNYTGMALLSTKPVKTLEDWNGLLVQAISPVIASMVETLGGSPVTGQPYTESYSLLEKGTVDAVITAPAAMRIFALTDVAKHMTAAYMVPAVHGFSINLDAWNKLPGDIQDILVEEAQKQSDVIDEWLKGEWTKDREAIATAGVEVFDVPQAELDKWKETCQPLFDQQMEALGEFGQKIKKIADDANAKYPN